MTDRFVVPPLEADPALGFDASGTGVGSSRPAPPAAGSTKSAKPSKADARFVKARQVQRVITRIDPGSAFRMAMAFSLCLWLILVVAGVLIWQIAALTGTIGKIENFLAQLLAESSFSINGLTMLEGAAASGLVIFVTGALLSVITTVLFNLVAAVFGGLRLTIVELETARPSVPEQA